MRKKYEKLKEQYPEYISKIQLYKVCGISPRTASYLLNNGIIPAIDTGKDTWRYKIKLEDVIAYLEKRDEIGSMIPPGAVSSRYKRPNTQRKSFAALVVPGREKTLAEYFAHIYAEYPDVLTAADIAEMTGFSKETIFRVIRAGLLKTLDIQGVRRYLIPKQYLMEYLQSPAFIESKSCSDVFKKVLGGFELWIAAK
nr:helix-turn-helix domain-containing protein [uncultured Eisenbergiella sp.]